MITLLEVNQLSAFAFEEMADARKMGDKRMYSRKKGQYDFYNTVKLFLESGPDAGAITTERNRLKKRIEVIKSRLPKTADEKMINRHNTLYEMKKLKAQLKFLQFILKH